MTEPMRTIRVTLAEPDGTTYRVITWDVTEGSTVRALNAYVMRWITGARRRGITLHVASRVDVTS